MSQDVTGLRDTCQRANVFQKQGRGRAKHLSIPGPIRAR